MTFRGEGWINHPRLFLYAKINTEHIEKEMLMLRLAIIGALMWALLGLTIAFVAGCTTLPQQEHHDSNIHAQPAGTILEV